MSFNSPTRFYDVRLPSLSIWSFFLFGTMFFIRSFCSSWLVLTITWHYSSHTNVFRLWSYDFVGRSAASAQLRRNGFCCSEVSWAPAWTENRNLTCWNPKPAIPEQLCALLEITTEHWCVSCLLLTAGLALSSSTLQGMWQAIVRCFFAIEQRRAGVVEPRIDEQTCMACPLNKP